MRRTTARRQCLTATWLRQAWRRPRFFACEERRDDVYILNDNVLTEAVTSYRELAP
jgi:hypothetical protein